MEYEETLLTAAQEGQSHYGMVGKLYVHTAALTTAQRQTFLLEYNLHICFKIWDHVQQNINHCFEVV